MATKKGNVFVLPLWSYRYRIDDPTKTTVQSTVAKNCRDLSPFCLGPCSLYGDLSPAMNMENAWQFAKVYPEHWNKRTEEPKPEYWSWAKQGWSDHRAHRYPMGKGRIPVCSWWDGEPLDYITARKTIYGPLYYERVILSEKFYKLRDAVNRGRTVILLDYDAYDHQKLGMSLTDVLNNPDRKMGHAFVLAMMLTRDKALKQLELRA